MEQYLIDTNIVSDYFAASLPANGLTLMDTIVDAVPNLSIITQIELLCWNTENLTEEKVNAFISDSIILDIAPEIVKQCVSIRRNHKLKIPDAIIAATALVNEFTLVTNNEKDFKSIDGLKLLNPHKIS